MDLADLEAHFVDIGGQFLKSSFTIQGQLENIKALVFDWDGVFNDGSKGANANSNFSDVDSLGVAMLRYAYFRATGRHLKVAVITGEANPSAQAWAKRDKIDALYSNCKNKEQALEHFCQEIKISPKEVACFYDDLLDLPMAAKAGLRFAVGRLANPIFLKFVEENHLADYISASQGNEHAVREFSELIIALLGQQEATFKSRMAFDNSYRQFSEQRNRTTLKQWVEKNGSIVVINT
jgi:3-deoxy-D-manno-octulosonate 8-phosphate phosphatase (KDO 8-P phosphatase)